MAEGKRRGTTKSNGQKDPFDRFYTSPAEASRLLSSFLSFLRETRPDLDPRDVVLVEPSAGAGAFVAAAEEAGLPVLAYDLVPPEETLCKAEIHKLDFLADEAVDRIAQDATELSPSKETPAPIAVIGNPPFGSGGGLAFAFASRCAALPGCAAVGFVMPPSALKDTAIRKTTPARLRGWEEMDDVSYEVPGGDDVDVPSKFCLYTREVPSDLEEDIKRAALDKSALTAMPFAFVSKEIAQKAAAKDPSRAFSIRRIGGTAGKASRSVEVSDQSNYFCLLRDGCTFEEVAQALEKPIPERDWSVGPRSLSRPEIARTLAERMGLPSGGDVAE